MVRFFWPTLYIAVNLITDLLTFLQLVELRKVEILMELHLRATGFHLTYGITHSCHPMQENTPRLNPSKTGRYAIYYPKGWEMARLDSDVLARDAHDCTYALRTKICPPSGWRRPRGRPRQTWLHQIGDGSAASVCQEWDLAVSRGHSWWTRSVLQGSAAQAFWWWWWRDERLSWPGCRQQMVHGREFRNQLIISSTL